MSIIKEFKEFAVKGNMVDLAVGVIIGGAFGKIVTSLVEDVLMPPIGVLVGGLNFKDLGWVLKVDAAGKPIATLGYGSFIQNIVNFLIVAASVFLFVKIINTLKTKMEKEKPAPAPVAPPAEIALLTEIRDLLKK